MMASTEVETGQ